MSRVSYASKSAIEPRLVGLLLLGGLFGAWLSGANAASAQSRLPEREEYRQGQGRGVQYGSRLISPIFLSEMRHPEGLTDQTVAYGAGLGIHGRIGWEFPLGFVAEIYGGFTANGIDTRGEETINVLFGGDVGIGLRYMLFLDAPIIPFAQIGGGLRFWRFDWPDDAGMVLLDVGAAFHAGLGFQLELAPYFAIETGVVVDYSLALGIFEDGIFSIQPFLGVMLYAY